MTFVGALLYINTVLNFDFFLLIISVKRIMASCRGIPITCTVYDRKDSTLTPEKALNITMKKFLPPHEYVIWQQFKDKEEDTKTRTCNICQNTTQTCILKYYGIPLWTQTAYNELKMHGTYNGGRGSTWESIIDNL